jgi:hypothetical protein
LPRAIQDAPDLWPGLELYFQAWIDLDSCRSIGLGVGPIPWTAIEAYSISMDLDSDKRARMHRLVRALDRVYLDHNRKQGKKDVKP